MSFFISSRLVFIAFLFLCLFLFVYLVAYNTTNGFILCFVHELKRGYLFTLLVYVKMLLFNHLKISRIHHFIFCVKIISLNLTRLNNELQWHIVKPSGSGSGDISSNPSRGEYIYNFSVLFLLGIINRH